MRENTNPRDNGPSRHESLCNGVRCPCFQEGIREGRQQKLQELALLADSLFPEDADPVDQ